MLSAVPIKILQLAKLTSTYDFNLEKSSFGNY